jgi:hypothetical protein
MEIPSPVRSPITSWHGLSAQWLMPPNLSRQESRGASRYYNVVPTQRDIYPTRSLDNNALIEPESLGRRPFSHKCQSIPTPKAHKTCGHERSSRLRLSLTQLRFVRDEPAQRRYHSFRTRVLVPLCSVDILASSDLLRRILVGYP